MTATSIREASSLSIRVNVPVSVPQAKHKEFKEALMELLFGYDRLRPEAVALVSQAGVDVEQLSRLSKPRPLGLCPESTDYEFKPNARLAKAAKEAGLLFTGGGQVSAYMDFEYANTRAAGPVNELHVSIGVPAALNYPEALDDISEGLFGTCDLSPEATSFLHAHGIDLTEIQTTLDPLPPTSRVSPKIAAILSESGFSTDRMGAIKTASMISEPIQAAICNLNGGWSKSTCC